MFKKQQPRAGLDGVNIENGFVTLFMAIRKSPYDDNEYMDIMTQAPTKRESKQLAKHHGLEVEEIGPIVGWAETQLLVVKTSKR